MLRRHADPSAAEVAAYRELREALYRERTDQLLERIERELGREGDCGTIVPLSEVPRSRH